MWPGTGEIDWVARLTTMMVSVDANRPTVTGASVVVSARLPTSQTKDVRAPATMDAMAPGVFAFFHHTAQKYAGRKALPSTEVAKMTMPNTVGGSYSATM